MNGTNCISVSQSWIHKNEKMLGIVGIAFVVAMLILVICVCSKQAKSDFSRTKVETFDNNATINNDDVSV